MTGYTRSPRLVKSGLVLIDPESGAIESIIRLQYNAETLSRSLQIQAVGEGDGRSQPLRLRGPAVETFTLDAILDATDQLEVENATAVDTGLFPQIAAMERLAQPTTAALRKRDQQASSGTLEIAPIETPLALFVWSRHRIVPVRITQLTIAEEAFDPNLNPIRAKVSIGMRSLSVDDLGFQHRGGGLFMAYLSAQEALARRAPGGALGDLGVEALP
jgi:hypothetical protein